MALHLHKFQVRLGKPPGPPLPVELSSREALRNRERDGWPDNKEVRPSEKEVMAKVKLNPTLEAIHGHVGDMVFKRFEGQEIVGKMPDRTGIVPTENQVAQQDKFRLAALYGKAVMADPATKKIYVDASGRLGVPAFALTVGDFLNAPVVDEIDLSAYAGKIGDKIAVRASDDVEVQEVSVAIRDQGGVVLEQGAAVFTANTGAWTYTATTALAQGQAVSIEVSATDRPGHRTTRTQARS